jgi:VanZ family protein
MKCFLKYWLPLLIWGSLIFVGSTNLMSAEHTSRFVVPFLLWLKPAMSPHTLWVILVAVRKCAHVVEYAVLAFLLWRALGNTPVLGAKMLVVFGAVVLGCALFAASDEFHQTFVKSRTPSVRDVLLDIAGAILGLSVGASFARRDPKKFPAPIRSQIVDV